MDTTTTKDNAEEMLRSRSVKDVLMTADSLHRFRQGYGLFSAQDNRYFDTSQLEMVLSVPCELNQNRPLEQSELTLLIFISDLIYTDVKTIRAFLKHIRKNYSISMPSDPDMIDHLVSRFARTHLVCKREQRAGKTDYSRPFSGKPRVGCFCLTSDGARLIHSQFNHRASDVRDLSLPMLSETQAFGIVAANFLEVMFVRTYIPTSSMDPYWNDVQIEFPKFKYIREFAGDNGNTTISPGRVILPARKFSDGTLTHKKACIFSSQLLGYNTAIIENADFQAKRKTRLALAQWSCAREKGIANDAGEYVETAIFLAIEDFDSLKRLKEELIDVLQSGYVDHIYLTSEGAVDEICVKGRSVLQSALIELRKNAEGVYVFGTALPDFFK